MKKALLVGINKYAMPGCDLAGCVNDVTNIRDILINYYDYKVENMRVICDERATYDAITDRLRWLVENTGEGDNLVFHYSGHGSQIRDRSGDELKDGLDEILCPYDMDWDSNFISDDDLCDIFSRLKSGTLDVLLDCCHAGTGTRNPYRIRYMKPPVDILCREVADLPKRGLFAWILSLFSGMREDDKPIVSLNHSLMAACKNNQTAADADMNGTPNGAFTYYLCKHIRSANSVISRSLLKDRIRDSLSYNGFDQVPQLEAPKKLFYGAMFA